MSRPDLSLLIAALRGLLLLAPLILLLPRVWGIDGIWVTTPIAELSTAVVALALRAYFDTTAPKVYENMTAGQDLYLSFFLSVVPGCVSSSMCVA